MAIQVSYCYGDNTKGLSRNLSSNMDYEVKFKSNTLHMAWKSVPNNYAYSLVVDKCDGVDEFGYDNCYQIFSKVIKSNLKRVQNSFKISSLEMH